MLGNLDIENADLDLKLVIADQEVDDECKEEGEYTGFCVFGEKMCVFGSDGLFVADLLDH